MCTIYDIMKKGFSVACLNIDILCEFFFCKDLQSCRCYVYMCVDAMFIYPVQPVCTFLLHIPVYIIIFIIFYLIIHFILLHILLFIFSYYYKKLETYTQSVTAQGSVT